MSVVSRAAATRTEPAYRVFETTVVAAVRLAPAFLRVTVTGADLDAFDDCGDDQRFTLVLPLADADRIGESAGSDGFADFPCTDDWYAAWRALPPHRQNPIRTYTVAGVRPAVREVDFVVVRHGVAGPASAWAETVRPGDAVLLVGPNARSEAPRRAAGWAPPPGADLLLAGDETAVPAIVAILAGLPGGARGVALLEVPTARDVLSAPAPPGVAVHWLARDGRAHGSLLEAAVRASAGGRLAAAGGGIRGRGDGDNDDGSGSGSDDLLWDVADDPTAPFYAWLAGEAGLIRTLRRHLVGELGVDRRAVTFMGYWRRGAAERN